ncbi:MAG: EAL domain-containing protein [Sulfurimonas sp.]|uniref:EAL domain-containing protein n=1 Tax=Sulfurimonas sp. TaxID=2022749 RepID=UPI00260A35F0|nr:EAL domain-containing protein [Sulfurimonas sp.]MCW8894695.1 EAL domain-containing protein [Sulfurimonas sp.]MCW8955102.1 EAL domain-containing protein [Sulfurimonas sp.]MCW9067115.1 EAL domain-containing protein [Sulfurimonas sp.]
MTNILNDKILKAIPVIFFVLIILKILYTYYDIKDKEYEFAKKEAEVLNSYAVSNRHYYQNLFLNGTLKLDERTLQALPAYSSNIISDIFSKNNPFNITLQAVSDRARNIDNSADEEELKAIKFFNENKEANEHFSDDNSEYYQYSSALRINNDCLKCHGKKEDAPKFIQETYEDAYNYKLGEVRGIISIKIPTENIQKYFISNFFHTVIQDMIILITIFIGIGFLLSKSKKINNLLSSKVAEKTKELQKSFLFERLTLLPNRLKLIQDIMLNSDSKSMHLALINIDSFKDINDLYGYDVGDKIIKDIAYKIKDLCNNKSIVYKLPTDEYAIFTIANISQTEFLHKLQDIIKKIQESKLEVNDNSVFITLSCGVVSNENDLMTKADVALQIAKKDKKSIVVYDNSISTKEKISKNMEALSLLKKAIKKDRITPYFQPIYNTHTKRIDKYECLVRIILDNGEVITPFVFLDIAVKSKLYPEITKAMIKKSFEYFKDKDYQFSINISMNDVQDKNTLQFITDSLMAFKEPKRVVFEILESDRIQNYEELKVFIQDIKRFGCQIAIDDFGSGYSNFSHIFELNVDYLKIDSSLVKFITTDDNSRIITKTIVSFASNLGLKTIAEFVEDKDSLDLLEKMGVDFIQGYYIGKPSPELNTDYD